MNPPRLNTLPNAPLAPVDSIWQESHSERRRTYGDLADNTQYLGFDYGERRIGVASGQLSTRSAAPLQTLESIGGKPNWEMIVRLVEQWQPVGLVIGMPLHMDGSSTHITARAQRFAGQLRQRCNLPVYHCDERLSSVAARELIRSARRAGAMGKARKGDKDKIAAAVILQHWLETFCGDG